MFRSTASTAPEPVQSPEASGRLVHVVFGDRPGYRIPEVRIERGVEGFAVHGHGPDLARSADVSEGIAVDQNDVSNPAWRNRAQIPFLVEQLGRPFCRCL